MRDQCILFFALAFCFNVYAQDQLLLPTSTTGVLIKHTYYTLSYSEEHEQAEWVAYELTKEDVLGTTKRTNSYRPDPNIKTGSSDSYDFKNSGYDRGHLAPAGDMKRNENAMSESFFYSNMSPQVDVFNQGIWNQLEIRVRSWALEKEHLFVVTGPVLGSKIDQIGLNNVTVPGYFYKALLSFNNDKIESIGFLLPNREGISQLYDYAVSIDELEKILEIDLWGALPDEIEAELESSVRVSNWFSKIELQKKIEENKTPLSPSELPQNTINSVEARNHIGKECTVCGSVVSANYVQYASATYLNLDSKYPNQHFSITIWGNNRDNFSEKPEDYYHGKTVCVSGVVQLLKGIPSINISVEDNIEIINNNSASHKD